VIDGAAFTAVRMLALPPGFEGGEREEEDLALLGQHHRDHIPRVQAIEGSTLGSHPGQGRKVGMLHRKGNLMLRAEKTPIVHIDRST